MAENPYLFVVGCARSGTTLLRRMLDAHPHIAMTRETHWISRIDEQRVGLTADGRVTPELLAHLLDDQRFRRMDVDLVRLRRAIAAGDGISYSRFVTLVFDLYGERHGKRLVGDKQPGYARKMERMHALWPWARFVHLVRDGRDVCLSVLEWRPEQFARRLPGWQEDPFSASALWWAESVRAARDAGRALGSGLYYEVRYEKLVADPEGECAALCRFLGVPPDEAMARFHRGRTRTKPGLDAKRAWLPVTKGLRDWRAQMPRQGAERFERAAGGLLEELGYPLLRAPAARGDPS